MLKKRQFQKKPLNFTELIQKMSDKGMRIADHEFACRTLRNVGYYRLTGYGLAFETYENRQRLGQFKPGTSFDQLINAYAVDSKLRSSILEAIERIEVAMRSIISHKLSVQYKTAHWYLDPSLFKENDTFKHSSLIREIARNTGKSITLGSDKDQLREIFIRHYYQHYDDPELPPSWMVAEVLSIGSWSKIYEHLAISRDRKLISSELDLSPPTLESWLHCLTFIRNACAHHGRLFARILPLPPKRDKNLPFTKHNYVFNFICVISYFLNQIEPDNTWCTEVHGIISELECDTKYFGIPKNGLINLL